MNNGKFVGLQPWLPPFLARYAWWTEPIRAERLAALRIGIAAVLVWDVLANYLPMAQDFFGAGSLGSPEIFAGGAPSRFRWTLLSGVQDGNVMYWVLALWAVAAACLLIGVAPRPAAAVAWLLSISIIGVNFYLHNSGDNVRTIALFYLMVCPCGAVWSIRLKGPPPASEPVYVPAWPVRLLFLQLVVIYFFNGVYKFAGADWRSGEVLHSVLANAAWTRFSYAQLHVPAYVLHVLAWGTLVFELGFPLLVMMPWTRTVTLWTGIAFHLGTGIFLRLGPFPLYMMCLYLPLVPWEKYVDAAGRIGREPHDTVGAGFSLRPQPQTEVCGYGE